MLSFFKLEKLYYWKLWSRLSGEFLFVSILIRNWPQWVEVVNHCLLQIRQLFFLSLKSIMGGLCRIHNPFCTLWFFKVFNDKEKNLSSFVHLVFCLKYWFIGKILLKFIAIRQYLFSYCPTNIDNSGLLFLNMSSSTAYCSEMILVKIYLSNL